MRLAKKIFTHFHSDSLYRNSIYLMLNTAIQAFFGFFFWIINARLYTTEQVGIATTLISVVAVISSFSILGLNIGLVRFLPKSNEKDEQINSSFIITALATLIISVVFILGLKTFSPKLLFLQSNIFYSVSFIIFVIVMSINSIAESAFLAYRSTIYTLIKNTILSIIKLSLPIFLLMLSAYGIFTSLGIANIVAFLFAIVILIYKFGYMPKISFNAQVIKKMGSYSFANYIGSFTAGIPLKIMPILITNYIGASQSAYFYIDMMIINTLLVIPTSTSQSLLAEASHNESESGKYIAKTIRSTAFFLVPAMLIILLFGDKILLAFGKTFSNQGIGLLRLFVLSTIFTTINGILSTILNIKKKLKLIILMCFIGPIILLSLTFLLIGKGLIGIGLTWLIGEALISVIYILITFTFKI